MRGREFGHWGIGNRLVGAGFMPAFKYHQKNSLIVIERGHKARAYESMTQ
jgi:hypothetical protein